MKTKITTLFVTLALFVLVAGMVSAIGQPSGATLSGLTDYGEIQNDTAGIVNLTSGNITHVDLDTTMTTFRWAGLMGDVSGNIELGDTAGATMFQWTGAGNLVYASTGNPTWSDFQDAVEGDMPAYLRGSDSDNYATTFVGGAENIGSAIFNTTTSDFATTISTGATVWKTYSLRDNEATPNLIWVGAVVEDGDSFRGAETVDYQMIIPEMGVGEDYTPTEHNLWVELY